MLFPNFRQSVTWSGLMLTTHFFFSTLAEARENLKVFYILHEDTWYTPQQHSNTYLTTSHLIYTGVQRTVVGLLVTVVLLTDLCLTEQQFYFMKGFLIIWTLLGHC